MVTVKSVEPISLFGYCFLYTVWYLAMTRCGYVIKRVEEIRALAPKFNDKVIAEQIGCSREAIGDVRRKYGILPCIQRIWIKRTVRLPSKEKLIYIAGFLDGEGSLHLSKYFKPAIYIEHTSFEIIDWLQAALGNGGTIQKCPWRNTNAKAKKSFRISKFKNIETLLQAIMPFLIVKKPQAKLLLEFVQLRLNGRKFVRTDREKQIYWELKKLNKRGITDAETHSVYLGEPKY